MPALSAAQPNRPRAAETCLPCAEPEPEHEQEHEQEQEQEQEPEQLPKVASNAKRDGLWHRLVEMGVTREQADTAVREQADAALHACEGSIERAAEMITATNAAEARQRQRRDAGRWASDTPTGSYGSSRTGYREFEEQFPSLHASVTLGPWAQRRIDMAVRHKETSRALLLQILALSQKCHHRAHVCLRRCAAPGARVGVLSF
jgi:hypothetical protein